MITVINNLFLFAFCASIAFLFYLLFQLAYEKYEAYKLWCEIQRNKKDELLKKREEKLENNAFNYYYTLAINSPELIARENAKRIVLEIRQNKKTNEMYSKMMEAV